jgi:hypothetical protein
VSLRSRRRAGALQEVVDEPQEVAVAAEGTEDGRGWDSLNDAGTASEGHGDAGLSELKAAELGSGDGGDAADVGSEADVGGAVGEVDEVDPYEIPLGDPAWNLIHESLED